MMYVFDIGYDMGTRLNNGKQIRSHDIYKLLQLQKTSCSKSLGNFHNCVVMEVISYIGGKNSQKLYLELYSK